MSASLDAVPNGSNILIDANVFVYGLTSQSPQCKNFLARCSVEQVFGITIFEVVHDATHHFMRAEAFAKGLFAGPEKGAKYLSKHPEEVKRLKDYWINTQRLLALNVMFISMELRIVVRAQGERAAAGLLTNDSIIVAAMREYGISRIATNDRLFDSVNGLEVFAPNDIP